LAGGVVAVLVTPDAVALVVVDVGVPDLTLVDRLQTRTSKAQEVRILGGVVQLYAVEGAVGVGNA